MANELSGEDFAFILESLRYTKEKFATYDRYSSAEFKRERVARVDDVMSKVRSLLDTKDG